jgi:hypothetical protein
VFAEPDLATSSRFFHLVWRSFLRAAPVLPDEGMGVLPRQLADRLDAGTVRLAEPVAEVRPHAVVTASGERLRARAVVVATDGATAATLVPGLAAPEWNGLTTFYYRTGTPPLDLPVITIDARRGPVVNTAVLSAVAPGYAPREQALICATTLGTDTSESAVRDHLTRLYRTSTANWELVAAYPIPHALPRMSPPHALRRPVRLEPGLYVCGDHRDTSSIQGALVSGRRTGRSVVTDLAGVATAS